MGSFSGWPPEALDFLRDLEANNEREWFKANRSRYDELLIAPARALAADLEHLGDAHLFRPFNDVRFHARPPIKEQVGVAIGQGGAGGWYLELSLDGLLVAGGLYQPARDQVARLRAAIEDGPKAGALTRAIRAAEEEGLALNEPDLARGPQGVPRDHPRIDLLRRRRMTVARLDPLEPWLHTPAAGARIRAGLEAAAPLVRWFEAHVGPSTQPGFGR